MTSKLLPIHMMEVVDMFLRTEERFKSIGKCLKGGLHANQCTDLTILDTLPR